MSQPTRTRRLTDRTGLFYLRLGCQVRITHPRHSYNAHVGRVIAINGNRVLINLGLGLTVWAGHRSVEVTKP